jgi:hypothetical protein
MVARYATARAAQNDEPSRGNTKNLKGFRFLVEIIVLALVRANRRHARARNVSPAWSLERRRRARRLATTGSAFVVSICARLAQIVLWHHAIWSETSGRRVPVRDDRDNDPEVRGACDGTHL